jgi:fluoroacetyl-CoA thioesterase
MLHVVTEADTAQALGSGDVAVLATPRLIAWLEAATLRAAESRLASDQTTVGVAIRVEHRRATAVGGSVEVLASPPRVAGRRMTFEVEAVDGAGQIVAVGEIDRVVVDRERFAASAAAAPD